MHRVAAGFIVRNGPVTQQDRWEEDAGFSPFTLAVEVAGLLAAADLADAVGEKQIAQDLCETADFWNDNIERWTYAVSGGPPGQSRRSGRLLRAHRASGKLTMRRLPSAGFVPIKNRPPANSRDLAVRDDQPDSLALVRFGLRSPDDPRIVGTVKVIDHLLRED